MTSTDSHAESMLPQHKQWELVRHDEFDGQILDNSKWDSRLHLLQQRHETFTDQGAVLDGKGNLLLTPREKDGHFYSPHLQTGSNYLDRPGIVSHNNHWNGYGPDHKCAASGNRQLEDTPDGFHVFGLDWSPDGYVYYIDGRESWRVAAPVSHREQFILISTECMGYRESNSPSEKLKEAVLPDYFIVDYVRVFDEVK